jgi:uncharacterized protein (TIGR02302 family)
MTERPIISNKHRRLTASRLATRCSMIVERGWPLVLPVLVVVSLFLSIAWLGLFPRMPDALRLGIVAAFGIAGVAALYPLRYFRLPQVVEIDRRIEAANNLLHSPVQVQTDRPSGSESGFSQALWREHQKRMASKLDNLAGDLPRTQVPDRDPWGLRAVAALLLVVAFAFSFGSLGGKVEDGFRAIAARDTVPPRIDAWVTPPTYTGKPPIFLTADRNDDAATITVPIGSDVSLRVTGGSGEETLAYVDNSGNSRAIDPSGDPAASPADDAKPAMAGTAPSKVRQFAGKLSANGTLTLKSAEDELGHWAFAVTPDKPPQIRFVGEPKRAANGTMELSYQIDDDYGAASAKAVFALADAPSPNAHPL